MHTLTIDIGGTGIKMIRLDAQGEAVSDRVRELTPQPATPEPVLAVITSMLESQGDFGRVSVGFPGVVKRGVTFTAPNLAAGAWAGFDLESAVAACSGKPTRVLNDAELQGYGVISGKGVEIVLTFGTGLGTALYVDGRLVPNLELGHHPLGDKGETYEDLVRDDQVEAVGKVVWRERVALVCGTLSRIFNYDRLYVGGGNARHIEAPLPEGVERFDNARGMEGGVALWAND